MLGYNSIKQNNGSNAHHSTLVTKKTGSGSTTMVYVTHRSSVTGSTNNAKKDRLSTELPDMNLG
jgi:hypothetical protein